MLLWIRMNKTKYLWIPYQVKEMEDKLVILRGGVTLVRPEERKAVEEMYSEKINQWRRRKRMFSDLWDAITENSPKDLKEFKVIYIWFISCKHMYLALQVLCLIAIYVFAGGAWNWIWWRCWCEFTVVRWPAATGPEAGQTPVTLFEELHILSRIQAHKLFILS